LGRVKKIEAVGDYAYTNNGAGLQVVNVQDPRHPAVIGSLRDHIFYCGISSFDLAVAGRYAYFTTVYSPDGMHVVDISDPTKPTRVSSSDLLDGAFITAKNLMLAATDGSTSCNFAIRDITDPLAIGKVALLSIPHPENSYPWQDIAVASSLAFVACNAGVHVVDVSTPSQPFVVTSILGSARSYVAASAGYVYLGTGRTLRILDVSSPAYPIEVGTIGLQATINDLLISDAYLYVSTSAGLISLDISTPQQPIQSAAYQSPFALGELAVSGDRIYAAALNQGLVILRWAPPAPGYVISPVWPTSHATASIVMQGGVASRYVRLSDADGNPVPGATVTFSLGAPATTDAAGNFTYTIQADTLGGPGTTQSVNVQSVSIGGHTYSTDGQPTFRIAVQERTYSHSWSYGAIRKASAGVNTGLIAYLRAETNGGLGLTLAESDPNRTDDDRVQMAEAYSTETGAEVGVGLRRNVNVGIIRSTLDASATTERSVRTIGALQSRFDQPYADGDRKAQGIFLVLSVLDSVRGMPTQPFVVSLLQSAEARWPYLDYLSEQSAGLGAKVTPLQSGVGMDISLSAQRGGRGQRKDKTVGFTLLDAGASRLVYAVLTDYGDEYSVGFEDELAVDLTLLSPDLPAIQNRLVGVLGNRARRIHKEYFFDSGTDRLRRIELTLSSEGNPSAFTDVTKKQVSAKIVLPAPSLSPALVEAVGEAQALSDLRTLLHAVPEIPYEVEVADGSSLSVVPELTIPGTPIEISLGAGLEVESLRNLVRERGVFLDGQPYATETYMADSRVARSGKSWTDLTLNALGGLWLLVRDGFDWVVQRVASGVQWTITVTARTTAGIEQGKAQLIISSDAQLAQAWAASVPIISQTEAITVTGIGWIPESVSVTGRFAPRPAIETASGAGFVVGGIYDFQPYTLTVSPSATLAITYTDAAMAGKDESRIGLFRWTPDTHNWQPIASQADLPHNTVTANVTQLGTYALGYDDVSPRLTILEPVDGAIIVNARPAISAIVTDAGVGVNSTSVVMQLDGQAVGATYVEETGELVFLPTAPLTVGSHTINVSASDVVGNPATVTATFVVREPYRCYLPSVQRGR